MHGTPGRVVSCWIVTAIALIAAGPGPTDKSAEPDQTAWRSERVCGPNCLYTLLKYRGINVSYPKLLESCIGGKDFMSLSAIQKTSDLHGLPLSLGRTDRKGLEKLPKPVIAHLEQMGPRGDVQGHFVLVLQAGTSGVKTMDGTTAIIHDTGWRDFEREWTGYLAYPTAPSTMADSLKSMGLCALLGLSTGMVVARFRRKQKPGTTSSVSVEVPDVGLESRATPPPSESVAS